MKRYLDFIAAVLLLLPAFGICAIVAIIVYIREGENPVLIQKRVGMNEDLFNIVKLRTMKKGTAFVGTHQISSSSITSAGKWIRKLKIDELPQIWNVLIGDMSLVGPRPCLPSQIELINERRKLGVYKCRPGVTGLAQINEIDMSTPLKLALLDSEYIENQNLTTDAKILVSTLIGRGFGDRSAPGAEKHKTDE